jgi:hypothetical protein
LFLSKPQTSAPDAPSDPTPDLAGWRLGMLQELAEIGMKAARKVGEDAERPDADQAEIALRYSRVSRAVRLTLALHERFETGASVEAERRRQAAEDDDDDYDASVDATPWLTQGIGEDVWRTQERIDERARQTEMVIEAAIERRECEPVERDRFTEALYERLEEIDAPAMFAGEQPLWRIVRRICADIGLDPDWFNTPRDDFGPIPLSDIMALRYGEEGESLIDEGDGSGAIPPRHGEGGEERSDEPGGEPATGLGNPRGEHPLDIPDDPHSPTRLALGRDTLPVKGRDGVRWADHPFMQDSS